MEDCVNRHVVKKLDIIKYLLYRTPPVQNVSSTEHLLARTSTLLTERLLHRTPPSQNVPTPERPICRTSIESVPIIERSHIKH